ncbi:TPA: hypothetical protein ACSTLU_000109 [Serratia fonticola]
MQIKTEHVPELLGITAKLDREILQALFEFTLVFSLAEQRLMGGYARGRYSGDYADTLVNEYGINATEQFTYFRRRYIEAEDGAQRLDALCPEHQNDLQGIYNGLTKQDPSGVEMADAVMKVAIRLRHNLFHGRKWEYMLKDQESNLNNVTQLLSQYLNAQKG